MARVARLFVASGLIGLIFLWGCDGSGNMMSPPPAAQSAQVSVSVIDAPPAGVTVLSFEVSVTGAALSPGNVNLLAGKGPIRIEVKKLETDTAFLSTPTIPSGDYSSLNLTFANLELTFRNDSGGTLAGCAAGNVCEIMPSGPLSSMVNGPFAITFDLNLASLVTQSLGVDFSSAGAVSVSQQAVEPECNLEDLDHVEAIISSIGSSQFSLQTADISTNVQRVCPNGQESRALPRITRFQLARGGAASQPASVVAPGECSVTQVDCVLKSTSREVSRRHPFAVAVSIRSGNAEANQCGRNGLHGYSPEPCGAIRGVWIFGQAGCGADRSDRGARGWATDPEFVDWE
jgi:hypothetical protein